jgi:tRNA(Ile2) C34 agmatinyltransferase TiaS
MNVGQTEKPKCPECGAKFISDAYWSFHYEDGSWRP